MEENNQKKPVMHIAALTLGIISIVFAIFWYISLPAGIIAIIFGVKSARRTGSKIAKAGMITGIVGVSLFAFLYMGIISILMLSNL